jgi:glycosyltransferase involved in cell wall biosynthesis
MIKMKKKIDFLSVVVPVYNDEEVLNELTERLNVVLLELKRTSAIDLYEVIYVDDGSKDKSWETIVELKKEYSFIKGIKLSRNFGQHNAILAGFDNVSGDGIILMDSDLQDLPEDIPLLLKKHKDSSADIIWARRKSRTDLWWVKLNSYLFYFVFNNIAHIKLPEGIGSFSFLTKRVINEFVKHRERARLHIGILSYLGFKEEFVDVEREESKRSFTNYPFWKRLKLAMFGIVSFSKVLLRFSTMLGFVFSALAFFMGGYYLIRKLFFSIPVPGYASLIVAMAFFSSIQLLILGIIGEYLGVILDEVKGRAIYIIDKEV